MYKAALIVACTVFIGAATAVPPALLLNVAPALEVRTSVRPVSHDRYQLLQRVVPGMYRCSVAVHDEPGSNRVWSTKDIVLAPGESGEQSATFGPLRLHFKASLSAKLDRAETTVTLTRDEQVITRQTSTVWLQREDSSIQPLR